MGRRGVGAGAVSSRRLALTQLPMLGEISNSFPTPAYDGMGTTSLRSERGPSLRQKS